MLRNYEKLKQLGKGSYGTVFLVQKHSNKCKYVLKEISLFGLTKPQREEVKNESDLLASMNSPYVVKYIESFEEKDILYIIASGGPKDNVFQNLPGKVVNWLQRCRDSKSWEMKKS